MKTALYPGSFNPWHAGHTDVLLKACSIFDIVLVCQLPHPHKPKPPELFKAEIERQIDPYIAKRISFDVIRREGFMVDVVSSESCDAVIRGLRNGTDLEYEQNLMYYNQDLGLLKPVVCFITEQNLSHISSSGARALGDRAGMMGRRYQRA